MDTDENPYAPPAPAPASPRSRAPDSKLSIPATEHLANAAPWAKTAAVLTALLAVPSFYIGVVGSSLAVGFGSGDSVLVLVTGAFLLIAIAISVVLLVCSVKLFTFAAGLRRARATNSARNAAAALKYQRVFFKIFGILLAGFILLQVGSFLLLGIVPV